MNSKTKKPPTAPPVYRPQPTPRVLQRKMAIQPSTQPNAPRVTRPVSPPIQQTNPRAIANINRSAHTVIQSRRPDHKSPVAQPHHNLGRPVIQRMLSDRRVEAEKEQMRQRTQKKTNMQLYAQGFRHLYRAEPNTAQQRMVSALHFGSNRSSASLITSDTGDTIYVAEQTGQAHKHPDEVWNMSGAETIACDEFRDRGLHAEMQIILVLLEGWKEEGSQGSVAAYLRGKIEGGVAVSKGKGCCQLCAAILLKLGVRVGYIQKSKFESIWVDPFEVAEIDNPFF